MDVPGGGGLGQWVLLSCLVMAFLPPYVTTCDQPAPFTALLAWCMDGLNDCCAGVIVHCGGVLLPYYQ
jgi:hypothetical protein